MGDPRSCEIDAALPTAPTLRSTHIGRAVAAWTSASSSRTTAALAAIARLCVCVRGGRGLGVLAAARVAGLRQSLALHHNRCRFAGPPG